MLECLAAPLLPSPYSALALVLLMVLWLLLKPPPREVYVAGLALLTAAVLLGWGGMASQRDGPRQRAPSQRWQRVMVDRYEALWRDLEDRADAARDRLAAIPGTPDQRRQSFEQLAAEVGGSGVTLMLFDATEEVVAWAGEGLVHDPAESGGYEPAPPVVRFGQRSFVAGFGSATFLVAREFRPGKRLWKIVAGRSFQTSKLPFSPPWPELPEDYHWSLAQESEPKVDLGRQNLRFLTVADTPTLVLEAQAPSAFPRLGFSSLIPDRGAGAGRGAASRSWSITGLRTQIWSFRLAVAAIGLALLSLAVLRAVGLAVQVGSDAGGLSPRLQVVLLGIAGLAAWTYIATGSYTATAGVVGGLILTALGVRRYRRERDHQPVAFKGVGAAALLIGGAWGLQRLMPQPLSLGGALLGTPEDMALRLAFAATAFGVFLLAGREHAAMPDPGSGWAWLSVLLLLGAAASHGSVAVSSALLAAAGVTIAVGAEPQRVMRRPGVLATTVVLTTLAAGTAWELAYRARLKEYVGQSLSARMAPPTTAALEAVETDLDTHFAVRDLAQLVPWDPAALDRGDLAYQLWRRSPLARRNAVSALVVRPEVGEPVSFVLGLNLDSSRREVSLPLELRGLPIWDALEVRGAGQLYLEGRLWGRLEYWLQPRPGFKLGPLPWGEEIEAALLRGGYRLGSKVDGLPDSVLYGLYGVDDGRALLTPWPEAPPLPAALRPLDPAALAEKDLVTTATVAIPSGSAQGWVRRGTNSWEVLYLPRLSPARALDRVATQAVSVLAMLALAALMILLLALPRAAFRAGLVRVVRSYSTRLVIVYTLLLLIPLPLLSAALTAGVEQRLRGEQRSRGEGALLAAQRVLADDLQRSLPGFGIEGTFFESRLRWIAAAVKHDIILYWQGKQFVSNRPELLTAGVRPERIPGEVYSRLSLGGYNLSSRSQRVGATSYVEIYGPFRLPGEPVGEESFFLSVPLLEQGEQVARELARLRRQALLVTAALFALVVAVGVRLAANFTRPITELVEGTRRIAAGAPSLDVHPADLELTVLADAVDDMARKVAESRTRLVREKQVVERMVQHITSGVVSLDRQNRVLLRNQVAAELIGAAVGEPLETALKRNERLAPVAAFLREVGRHTEQRTVRLAPETDQGAPEREWSLVWVPVPGSGEPAALLVVEDATEVLRSQRLQAWAEMARIIAHEIKNPLTPIRLSAEHMRQVHQRDPEDFDQVFERCTSNILNQVQELQDIAGDFSTYSSILRAELKPGDLVAVMAELFESYRAAPPPGIEVRFEAPDEPAPVRLDARLLGRAVRNLLENAVRAVLSNKESSEVVLRIEVVGTEARLAVLDRGPGVPEEIVGRIFDPYFSTHDTGTGLGLPIARRVAEEHGGTINARNRAGGGLAVVMVLPLLNLDEKAVL